MSKSRASKQNDYFAAVSRQRNDVYKTQRGKKRREEEEEITWQKWE